MWRSLSCVGLLFVIFGCGGGGGGGPAPAPPPPPPPPPNTTDISADLSAQEVVGGGASMGSATTAITLNLDDMTITGTVTLTGLTATGVTLKQGFAGETGTVLITLDEDSSTQWSLPGAAAFTQADLDALNAGGLYVEVTTAGEPDGAVRGQLIVGNIKLIFTVLSGDQAVPRVTTMGTAFAAITYDPDTDAVVVHVNTSGLDDATAGHIHEAVAGLTGGIRIDLVSDPNNVAHWFTEDAMFDAAQTDAFAAGALYVNIHTPANPGGEVRGQIKPDGVEIDFTELVGADVVPPVATTNSGIAAATIQTPSQVVTIHVNLSGLDDASSVGVFQAPVGQNGPEVVMLTQDANDVTHWMVEDLGLTASQSAALSNQGLYLSVQTPAWTDGEVRGQLTPEMSAPGSGVTFVVSSINPANGSTVDELPGNIAVTFNRDLLADSVAIASAEVLASGGDGSFGDGNETVVNIANISASTDVLTVDLSGATNMDDVYQLTLDGTSVAPLSDADGVVMDGDGDDDAGGDFISTFTVTTPAPGPTPTFTQIQTDIFTPNCAVSGCHLGATAPLGLDLSAGLAYGNLVNVASGQNATFDRVEPGDANNSYLVMKLEGNAGTRMPLGQPALPNAQIQMVRDWIDAGAAND